MRTEITAIKRHCAFYSSTRDSQMTLDDAMPVLPLLTDSDEFTSLDLEDGHYLDTFGDGVSFTRPGSSVWAPISDSIDVNLADDIDSDGLHAWII